MLLPVRSKYDVEIRTLTIDFADDLAPTETLLAPATVAVDDPALTATVLNVADASVQIRVAAGLPGHRYVVAVRCWTSFGNTLQTDLAIEVVG